MDWEMLARIADSLGVLTVVFSFYAAWRLYRQNRRLIEVAKSFPPVENFKGLIEAYKGVKSSKPVALAISVTPGGATIKSYVETFLRHQGWTMDIAELNMNGINNTDDMETFVKELISKKREFELLGCTELHLFIAGPMPACVQVGAVFDNWLPVKLYHKPQNPPPQVYEYWMPLTK